MGFFDAIKQALGSTVKKEVVKAVSGTVENIGNGRNHTETFTFSSIPSNLSELQALSEAKLDSAFKTTALTLLALCRYKESPEDTFAMLDFLKGPENVSTYEKQFIKERLYEKEYIPISHFNGATPSNNYTPSLPLTISVYETPYSFDNENWATLWVKSGGGDNLRSVKLRKKPSTGQWFLNDIQCLSEIRKPVEKDDWA